MCIWLVGIAGDAIRIEFVWQVCGLEVLGGWFLGMVCSFKRISVLYIVYGRNM